MANRNFLPPHTSLLNYTLNPLTLPPQALRVIVLVLRRKVALARLGHERPPLVGARDNYLNQLLGRARREKNVKSTPSEPSPVAAHMELELHKPTQTSVIGVQCDPAPAGGLGGVTISAMNDKALGLKAGLRGGDTILSVNGQPCPDPTQTATLLKAAEGRIVFELVRSEVVVKPKANPLLFWKR